MQPGMTNQMTMYAPIRMHTDGEEFVQSSQASHSKSWVEHCVDRDQKWVPEWCEKYPLVRVGRFECTEIREG